MTTSTDVTRSAVEEIAWKGRPSDPQDVRLLAALLDAQRRLSALIAKLDPQTAEVCRNLLRRADNEAGRTRYVAWNCLLQLDSELLAAMTDEERTARWCTLRAEAEEKLKGSWRGTAAEYLVKQAPKEKPVPLHLVRELLAHITTAAENQQHKLELFQRRSLPWLTALLAAAVAGTLVFAYVVLSMEDLASRMRWGQALIPWAREAAPWAQALVLGIPSGALGGILSMAFSLGRADLKAKIPDMRLSRLVTITRPLLGATVAIPVVVFVQAGHVRIAGFEGSVAIFALCFLGGFSERWFLGMMERMEVGKK